MKKLLSFALACIMLLSFAVPAFADVGIWPTFEYEKTKLSFDAAQYATNYVCVKEKMYDASDKSRYRTYTFSYDENGQLTRIQQADTMEMESGSVEKTTWNYAGKNFKYNSSGDLTSNGFCNYAYNSKGLLSKKTEKDEDYTLVTTYSYDNNGRITKAAHKTNGQNAGTDSFVYDKTGLLTKAVYNAQIEDSMYTTTVALSYDSNNNITKVVATSKESESTYKDTWKYKYNSDGNLASDSFSKYTYDSKGRLVKETIWKDERITYIYDKNNNLAKTVHSYNDGDGWEDSWITVYTFKKLPKKISKIDAGTLLYADYGYVISSINKHINLAKWQYTYTGKAIKPKLTIDSLQKGADYYLQYSNNVNPGKGKITVRYTDGSPSNVIFFNILPQKPTDLKVTKVSKTAASLSWSKVTGANKYIVYQYDKNTGKYTALATVAENNTTIKNLKAGTAYQFCVKAVHGKLNSAYSAKVTAKTAK